MLEVATDGSRATLNSSRNFWKSTRMPKIKNKEKCYVILDQNGYIYGAFQFNEGGKIAAEKYKKKIEPEGEKYIIAER